MSEARGRPVFVTMDDVSQHFKSSLELVQIPSPPGGPRVTHCQFQLPSRVLKFAFANEQNYRLIEITLEISRVS